MYNEDIFNSATIEGMLAAPGLKWHKFPSDVIPLWIADPDFPTAPGIRKAIQQAVDDEDFLYSDDTSIRALLAEKISAKNGIPTSKDEVYLTPGVIPALWLALKYSCKPGDEVVITDPSYNEFKKIVDAADCKINYWRLDEKKGYKHDVEELKKVITNKTKLIINCNPSNPTGRVLTVDELKGLADVAVDKKISVVSDELWEDIIFDDLKHVSLASLNPQISEQTITAWGFSKTWGVAGLQSGYLTTTNKEILTRLQKLGTGVIQGVNNIALRAIPVMVDRHSDYWKRDMMKQLYKMRDFCYKRFKEMGNVEVPELQGTYLMFPKFNYGLKSIELEKILREQGKVALSTGTNYGPSGEYHMRMLIGSSEEIVGEGLNRIESCLKTLKM
jgi:cystathionine beta-lyase